MCKSSISASPAPAEFYLYDLEDPCKYWLSIIDERIHHENLTFENMPYVELKYLKAECWLPGVWEGPGFYLQGRGKCSKIRKLQGCECLKCH